MYRVVQEIKGVAGDRCCSPPIEIDANSLSHSLVPLSRYSFSQLDGGYSTGLGDARRSGIHLQDVIENELRDLC